MVVTLPLIRAYSTCCLAVVETIIQRGELSVDHFSDLHMTRYAQRDMRPGARERFEFAVEWPLAGIDLAIVELDGAAIVDAAERSVSYWPAAQ